METGGQPVYYVVQYALCVHVCVCVGGGGGGVGRGACVLYARVSVGGGGGGGACVCVSLNTLEGLPYDVSPSTLYVMFQCKHCEGY